MIRFHNKIIKTGNMQSMFAVRFSFVDKNGKGKSPYVLIDFDNSSYDFDLSAVSISESEPCKAITSRISRGIFCISLDEYIYVNNANPYVKRMRDESNTQIIVQLIEYTEDDVVIATNQELAVRQCNVVFQSDSKDFKNKADNGELFDIMDSFLQRKKTAPANTYAHPVADIAANAEFFCLTNKMVAGTPLYETARTAMLFADLGSIVYNFLIDTEMLQWYCLISSVLGGNPSKDKVSGFVNPIRKTFLSDFTEEKVKKLIELLSIDGPKTVSKKETRISDILHDAMLIARNIISNKITIGEKVNLDESLLRSNFMKLIHREGMTSPNLQ